MKNKSLHQPFQQSLYCMQPTEQIELAFIMIAQHNKVLFPPMKFSMSQKPFSFSTTAFLAFKLFRFSENFGISPSH
jgi:hypothetical protein